jgi:CheY-like chemotaxis protein/ABC-type transporter Mla MlaB component
MPATQPSLPARVSAQTEGEVLRVNISGNWHVTAARPDSESLPGGASPRSVKVSAEGLEHWDTSLLLFLMEVQAWARDRQSEPDFSALPEGVRRLLDQLARSHSASVPHDRSEGFISAVGQATLGTLRNTKSISHFVGETVLSSVRLMRNPVKFRWRDWVYEMQQCGAMALPIVSLISFLVGVTLAYTGAIVLRQYGADVRLAASAPEALEAMSSGNVDVLVSDVAMPKVDGHALIRRVRAVERDRGASSMPAIALTAHGSAEERERALAAGFDAHIAKPVEPEDLAALIAVFAGSDRARAASSRYPSAT